MTTNFKSFFLFISAFLINVQFTTPVDPAVTEESYFSEQVTELVSLERQENAVLFAQFLINEIVDKNSFQQSSFIGSQFNQDHANRQKYQQQQSLALNHQRVIQLKINSDDYLIHFYQQSFFDENNTSALFQLS